MIRPQRVGPVRRAQAAPAGKTGRTYDLVVLDEAFGRADLGLRTAIIERYTTLGRVYLNVGCIFLRSRC